MTTRDDVRAHADAGLPVTVTRSSSQEVGATSGVLARAAIDLAERGLVPDALVRVGIRSLLRQRLRELDAGSMEDQRRAHASFVRELGSSPVAIRTDAANRQHYELPAEFFRTVLGSHLKYSCCWWPEGIDTLEEAERASLELTCTRARIDDGMKVLDFGCGWGSLTLWIASHFPGCHVLAVSNSRTQAAFIRERCRDLDLSNVEVQTADATTLDLDRRFDRVVSVEMFEHLRNWGLMFERIARWLAPDGRMFLHVFCHRRHAYPYTVRSAGDWMSEHFFTGGMMPSDDLPLRFAEHLRVVDQWRLNGRHYSRTLEAWLERQDANADRLAPLFAHTYGEEAGRWMQRWRLFFLACSELFAFNGGNEWYVSHYLLEPRSTKTGRNFIPS